MRSNENTLSHVLHAYSQLQFCQQISCLKT